MEIVTKDQMLAYLINGNQLTIEQLTNLIDSLSTSSVLGNLTLSGNYRPTKEWIGTQGNITGLGLGEINAFKVTPAKTFNVTSLSVVCGTAVAGANIRLGLYSDLAGVPNQLLTGTDTGNLSCAATGLIESAITTTTLLATETYWFAYHVSSNAIGLYCPANVVNDIYRSTDSRYYASVKATRAFSALPATFPAITAMYLGNQWYPVMSYLKVQ